MRKTKIICTIGPSTSDEKTMTQMCLAGMNVARLNFSHGTHEDHKEKIDLIKRVREKLDMPIPIIANGDIKSADALDAVQKLGYSGAMIGRGLLGKPWMLAQVAGEDIKINVMDVVLQHLRYAVEYYGEKTAVPMFRKHAAWYSAGMPNSSDFRIRVNRIDNADALIVAIRDFWGIMEAN